MLFSKVYFTQGPFLFSVILHNILILSYNLCKIRKILVDLWTLHYFKMFLSDIMSLRDLKVSFEDTVTAVEMYPSK